MSVKVSHLSHYWMHLSIFNFWSCDHYVELKNLDLQVFYFRDRLGLWKKNIDIISLPPPIGLNIYYPYASYSKIYASKDGMVFQKSCFHCWSWSEDGVWWSVAAASLGHSPSVHSALTSTSGRLLLFCRQRLQDSDTEVRESNNLY